MQAHFEGSQQAFEALEARLNDARDALRGQERGVQEVHFAERNLRNRIAELRHNVQVANGQTQQIVLTLEDARAGPETIDEQTTHTGLQEALECHAEKKEELGLARMGPDALTAQLCTRNEQRLTAERA